MSPEPHGNGVERTSLGAGSWWRFSHYILNKGLVRPGPGAKLERYDPWAENAQSPDGWAFSSGPTDPGSVRKERSAEPGKSYLTLIDLLCRAGVFLEDPDRRPALRWLRKPGPEAGLAVLAWCSDHGLLGLMLDDVSQIRLAPRYRIGFGVAIPEQKVYSRTETGWDTIYLSLPGVALVGDGVEDGSLVPQSVVRHEPGPIGPLNSGVIQRFRQGVPPETVILSRPLGTALAHYFPDVPRHLMRTHDYPAPLSEQFWREYAESVDQILYAAERFWDAFQCLSLLTGDTEVRDHLWNPLDWESVQAVLRELVGPIHPKIVFRKLSPNEPEGPAAGGPRGNRVPEGMPDGLTVELSWETNSLFSAFVLMAVQDYSSGLLRQCENCGAWMRVEKQNTWSCSQRCQHAAKVRRYRTRKKVALAPPHAENSKLFGEPARD